MTNLVLWMTLASALSGDGEDPRLAEPRPPVPGLMTDDPVDTNLVAGADTDTVVEGPATPSADDEAPVAAPPSDSIQSSSASDDPPAKAAPDEQDANLPLLSHATQVDGVDGWHVTVGPYLTLGECRRALHAELMKVTDAYVEEYLGRPGASHHVDFGIAYIRAHLLLSEPEEQFVDTSFGEMRQLSAQLKFDDRFQLDIDTQWREAKVLSRMLQTVLAAGVGFLLLGTLFGYLKLDTATRGSYSRRLQFMSAAVILTLVVSGALIARWIPWM